MTDGIGTTSYSYLPVGSPGGLAVAAEDGPLASDTIDYGYDALGRMVSRTVQGAGPETWAFDDIGRLVAHGSDLGNFTLSYLGETDQITERALTGSTLATSWSYLTNHDDRRLSEISNVGLSASQYSTFAYVMTPEQLITAITQTSDASASYPSLKTQSADYNDLNQLTLLDTQSLTYDANGNLLSDGQRNYEWDAENRLISITYPAESGKKTEFAYDGLSRRTEITNTPAGGGTATTTLYTWCSSAICQARNPENDPVREYFAEGEYVPGTSPQTYFYGIDQIGSVRRAFVDTSTAPAYDYDPYGVMTSGTAPVADFGYAGMFDGTDSGLYLTQFRAYDPSVGRWISRDPVEDAAPTTNLYSYVQNSPINYVDADGRQAAPFYQIMNIPGYAPGLVRFSYQCDLSEVALVPSPAPELVKSKRRAWWEFWGHFAGWGHKF
jgi:RHS repeat-associated protein